MKTTTLLMQLTLVVGLTVAVGVPQFREPVRAATLWRTGGPLTPRPELVSSDSRFAYEAEGTRRGDGSIITGTGRTQRESERQSSDSIRNETSGIRTGGSAGGRMATLNGRAATALNQPVPFARVVLRSIVTGQVQAQATADSNGRFTFGDVLTSGYVVEMIGIDGSVIAASQMVGTSGGGTQQAVVRVSGNSTGRALFGSVGTSSGTPTGSPTGSGTGTTTGTSTTATSTTTGTGNSAGTGGNTTFGSTASEPIARASELGIGQTSEPDENASPRN
jgi:hypothetical protein